MWQSLICDIIEDERIPLRWIFAVPALALASLLFFLGCIDPLYRIADFMAAALLAGLALGVVMLARWRTTRRLERKRAAA